MSLKPKPGSAKKKRSISSHLWLARQAKDPYVIKAKKLGYRSRAAFKLLELDDQFHFLKPGKSLVDLGAAPGGWLQIASTRLKPNSSGSVIIGIDLLPIAPMEDILVMQGDFTEEKTYAELEGHLKGKVDIVLSDMSPSTTGHAATDHIRIVTLCEMATAFAMDHLAPHGVFIMKVFQGGTMATLLQQMRPHFDRIKHVKPPASRKESSEIYLVALGFKGKKS